MTTIILTIIGILLAAAAALMVIFYGGDAFNAGSVGARANTLQNGGTNVISALQLAKADGNTAASASLTALQGTSTATDVSDDYLKEFPSMSTINPSTVAAEQSAASLVTGHLEVTNVPDAVCARVNKNLGVAAAVNDGKQKMGCDTTAKKFFAYA